MKSNGTVIDAGFGVVSGKSVLELMVADESGSRLRHRLFFTNTVLSEGTWKGQTLADKNAVVVMATLDHDKYDAYEMKDAASTTLLNYLGRAKELKGRSVTYETTEVDLEDGRKVLNIDNLSFSAPVANDADAFTAGLAKKNVVAGKRR